MFELTKRTWKVYAQVDEDGRVLAINSSAFLPDVTGWTLIDEGEGDRYHHAQGNYMPLPLWDDYAVCRYKLENGSVVERTAEEMQADYDTMIGDAPQSTEERLAVLEEQNAMLTECLLEMSELVYV